MSSAIPESKHFYFRQIVKTILLRDRTNVHLRSLMLFIRPEIGYTPFCDAEKVGMPGF